MMKKAIMAVAFAGAVGLAGLLVPGLASSHEGDNADTGGYGPCGGGGYGDWGPGGMMGGGYAGGMMGGGHGGGMMGGYGHGAGGMMGARGGWRGAGGLGPIWQFDLSDAQRTQVNKIADELRRSHWNTLGQLQDAQARLYDLQSQPQPDPKKVGAAYADVAKLQQQLIETRVQARNEVRQVLSPAQRQQYDRWSSGRFGPGPQKGASGGTGMANPSQQ